MNLERLVAEIVAVILLFVESAGSFAEFGAFTENRTILERLVAVIDNQYREKNNSFIYLGPTKRLLNHDEESLVYASWLDSDGSGVINDESATKIQPNYVNFCRSSRNGTDSQDCYLQPLPEVQ